MDTPPRLTPLGRTFNCEYRTVDEDIVIVMPDAGLKDDAAGARINVDYQMGYARQLGRRCAYVVVMNGLLAQDAGARKVYAEGMDPRHTYAIALVVSNPLARAIGSFFLGLSRPKIVTRMFDSIEAAIAWSQSQRPAREAA